MKKQKNIIRSSPFVLSFLFLCNPNLTVIDPLPDFFGYIFLCIGIYKLSDIHDRVEEAYRAFKRMIFIDAGKWLAVLWIFGMTVPSERNSSLLLWTFVFAVLEAVFLIPAYTKLFDGITQVGYLYPSVAIFGKNEKSSKTDRIRRATVFFVMVKAILGFLPELADLTNASYDESSVGAVNLYKYIGLMRVMAFVPTMIIGVIWFFRICLYFRAISKDIRFTEALSVKYEQSVLPRQGIFLRRHLSTAVVLMIIAVCFTVDFKLDSQNILPDFIAAIMFIAAFVFIGKVVDHKFIKWGMPSIAYFAVSVTSAILEYKFFERYDYKDIIKSDAVRTFYIVLASVNILKAICLFVLIYLMCRALYRVVSEHTGYVVGMERIGESEERLVASVQRELKRGFTASVVMAALYAVSDICFDIFSPMLAVASPTLIKINGNFFDIGPSEMLMVVINLIFAAVFIVVFMRALFALRQAVDTKYMLE